MGKWTRREFLKTTSRASVGLAALRAGQLPFIAAQSESSSAQPHSAEFRSNTRWRSLLDSDWLFHFSHAAVATKDFGYPGNPCFRRLAACLNLPSQSSTWRTGNPLICRTTGLWSFRS